jgi:hypothetical protein
MKKKTSKFEKEWEIWQEWMQHQTMPMLHIFREAGVKRLLRDWGEGIGISSSDTNHAMFQIWKDCNKDFALYKTTCLQIMEE